jgi:2-desacetyl-2-hydroxyethyl bacteriochlorophyllide A dehydrogenase
MQAAVLVEPCKLEIQSLPVPEPGPGEVLIRVTLAGICGSDFGLYQGKFGVPLPVIPGHEAIGCIEKSGPGVMGLSNGQRVTIQPNFACGTCSTCLAGYPNLCTKKIRLGIDTHGVFADYVVVPAAYVWPLPEDLADEVAVLAEPLAVAVHALRRVTPGRGERVLILGSGLIGLLTLQLAVQCGAEVTACDLADERLALAESLGATRLLGAKSNLAAVYNNYDLIYETSGSASALSQAVRLAAPRGKIVMLGLPSQEYPLPAALIVRKELLITGSMIYTDEFAEVIEMLQAKRIISAPLISAKYPLNEIRLGFENFSLPTRFKTLVEM